MKIKNKNIIYLLGILFISLQGFSQIKNPNVYNIFYYENDSISSEGFLKDGKPNGYWKNYERNGQLKSEGNRKNFLLDSTWKFYSNGFIKEQVEYEKNKKNGLFLEYTDSGVLYSKSTFVNDTLQGKRIIYYSTGEEHFLYNYLDGNYNGMAYELREDSTIISIFEYNKGKLVKREIINRFNSENKKTGLWKEYGKNGILKEEGEYKNGKKNGIFKEYKYNGELKELKKYNMDELQINAEELKFVELYRIYYPTGELHFTIAKDDFGKRQGISQEYDKKGNILGTEIYKNDTLFAKGLIDEEGFKQGEWKFYNKNNTVIGIGNYKDDYKTDSWELFFENGKKEQKGKYSKGKLSGKWNWFYESGKLRRKENYRKGKEDGEFVEYDETGKILTKGNYFNGLKDGEWFYEVGDHTEIGSYVDGLKDGEWKHYYLTEQVYFKGTYKNGKPVGKHEYFYADGNKKWVGSYNLGKKEGKWIKYNNLGEVIITYEFRNDVLIKIDGKKIKPAFKEEIN